MAKRTLTGIVTSAKCDRTITVTVTSRETHPLYGKQFTVNRKYTAHDQENQAGEGDKVVIIESRPISKTKNFVLSEIVEKSRGSIELKEEVKQVDEKEVA